MRKYVPPHLAGKVTYPPREPPEKAMMGGPGPTGPYGPHPQGPGPNGRGRRGMYQTNRGRGTTVYRSDRAIYQEHSQGFLHSFLLFFYYFIRFCISFACIIFGWGLCVAFVRGLLGLLVFLR